MSAAPIIVTALFGERDFTWLDGLRRAHFPAERNQVPAHLTLFHHLPPSLLPELHQRLSAEAMAGRPAAMIGEPILLGQGVALRVHSEGLADMRARLADLFSGLLTPQDAAGWRPHVTIQNKVPPAQARLLHQRLSKEMAWPRPLILSGLATWRYLGGPWEPAERHRFRG